jgi:nucleotide-binding universal stress UspA family protein
MTTKAETAKILIPVGEIVSKELITQALHVLSAFKSPLIVLFHVIEIPSRTATLETEQYEAQIKSAKKRLVDFSTWLTEQGLEVRIKVAIARNTAQGIVDEVNNDGYLVVFLMKRKMGKGWKRLFHRSVSEMVIRSANCLVMIATLE